MSEGMQISIFGVCLVAAVLASAVGCVTGKHEARKLFTELQVLIVERDRLEVDWGRLQIEQSAWSTHARVEQLARKKMKMRDPDAGKIRLIGQPDESGDI
jgi:cell division protein FtsL